MLGSSSESSNSKNTDNLKKCIEFCIRTSELDAKDLGINLTKLDREILEGACTEDCKILMKLLEEDKEFREEMEDFLQKLFNGEK